MAGIKLTKVYTTTNINNTSVANNWMVLVFGVTYRGPVKPTLVESYNDFTNLFGQAVEELPTHAYVRFLLESGVPVLFRRIIDASKIVAASVTFKNSEEVSLFSVKANSAYAGDAGNKISVAVVINDITKSSTFQIKYEGTVVETFSLGQVIDIDGEEDSVETNIGDLVYNFIYQASRSTTAISNYVDFSFIEKDSKKWTKTFPGVEQTLTGGSQPANDAQNAITELSDSTSSIYKDVRILQATTYYPQLRFCTTGGLCSSDIATQERILENLGVYATNCQSTFRVLVDYSIEVTDISIVRNFARRVATTNKVSPSIYAYFGYYGADNNNNYLPGSAGFLTALARSGYNVYNRRIAGTTFSPAFTKPYKEIYVDAITDWQDEKNVQINPIVIIDSQDNLAVMGSSTLAMPLSSLSARNPAQSLDVCCVGDYVGCILHNLALGELEAANDRLNLNSLANRMSVELERFVSSKAITRYTLDFDTTKLGKLGVTCTLYFAINLEEVSITLNSVYDTNITVY